MDKKCLNCGKIFTTIRRNKYCSTECKRTYIATTTVIAICRICGVNFERKVNKPNICTECRRKERENYKNIHNKTSVTKTVKKADFSEYEKWHKETGQSYGKYQLMKRKKQGEVW